MKLFSHQTEALAFLQGRDRALISLPAGAGKSAPCILSAGDRVIILCPTSAIGVWEHEVGLWRPDLTTHVVHRVGELTYPEKGECVIVTPHRLGDFHPETPRLTLLIDELHILRKGTAGITRRARDLAANVRRNGGRTIGISATPLLHRPDDLMGVLILCGLLEDFGGELDFNRLFGRINHGRSHGWGVPKPEVARRLKRLMFRKEKAECLPNLPPRRFKETIVELSGDTSKLAAEQLIAILDRGHALETATKLSRVDRSPSFTQVSKARAAMAVAKIPAMMEWVEDMESRGEVTVVFSSHRAPIDVLALRDGWKTITGETSPTARTKIVREFQAGKLKGLGITEAASVAITLTRANQILCVSDPWAPAIKEQATDRLWRNGQKRPVIITNLVTNNSLERRVSELHREKNLIINESVGMVR